VGSAQQDCPDSGIYEFDVPVISVSNRRLQTQVQEVRLSGGALVESLSQPFYYRAAMSADGYISSQVSDGASLFIGGGFSRVMPSVAWKSAALDQATGRPSALHGLVQGFNGAVEVLLVHGDSLYVGGSFTEFRGTPAAALAKIDLLTGELDTAFTQAIGLNSGSYVLALLMTNNSLYVGGFFTTYRGATANRLMKIDPGTGNLDTTFASFSCSRCTHSGLTYGRVTSLAADSTSLYVGGDFRSYRIASTRTYVYNIAKLDLNSGDRDTTFTGTSGFGGGVNALELQGGSLFVGGTFTSYRGNPVGRIAKISTTDGALDATFHAASPSFDGVVDRIVSSSGSLYLGGGFTQFTSGGVAVPVASLVKVDATTAVRDSTFDPAPHLVSASVRIIRAKAIQISGDALYVGGEMARLDGASPSNLIRLDLASGAVDSRFNEYLGLNESIQTLAMRGEEILVGGSFTHIGGTRARGLAQISLATLKPVAGMPSVEGTVNTLAVSGGYLYVGGELSEVGGVAVSNLAKVDITTQLVSESFAANAGADDAIYSLAVQDTSLFVGGRFQNFGVNSRVAAPYLVKVSKSDGALQSFFTLSAQPPDGSVYTLAPLSLSSSDYLCLGGAFTQVGGVPSSNLSCVSSSDGVPLQIQTGWDPSQPNQVRKIVSNADGIFLAGDFYNPDGSFRTVAGISFSPDVGGVLTGSDNPLLHANQPNFESAEGWPVATSLLVIGNSLWVSGNFDRIGVTRVPCIGKLDLSTGALDSTFQFEVPAAGPDFPSFKELVEASGFLHVQGHASRGEEIPYGLRINATTGAIE